MKLLLLVDSQLCSSFDRLRVRNINTKPKVLFTMQLLYHPNIIILEGEYLSVWWKIFLVWWCWCSPVNINVKILFLFSNMNIRDRQQITTFKFLTRIYLFLFRGVKLSRVNMSESFISQFHVNGHRKTTKWRYFI